MVVVSGRGGGDEDDDDTTRRMTTDDPRARPGHTTLRASRRFLRAKLRSRRRRLLRAPLCSGARLECRRHLLLAPAHDDRRLTDEAALRRRRRRRLVVVVVELLLLRGSAAAVVQLVVGEYVRRRCWRRRLAGVGAGAGDSVAADVAKQAFVDGPGAERRLGAGPPALRRRRRRRPRRPRVAIVVHRGVHRFASTTVYGTGSACGFTRVLSGVHKRSSLPNRSSQT